MGSPSYEVRRLAYGVVSGSDHFAAAASMAAFSDCPEVRRAAERWWDDHCTVWPSKFLITPWIDMMPGEGAARDRMVNSFLDLARAEGAMNAGDWEDYRRATALWITSERLRGTARAELMEKLDKMAQAEQEYRQKRSMPLHAAVQ
jgi:hypothetical protein